LLQVAPKNHVVRFEVTSKHQNLQIWVTDFGAWVASNKSSFERSINFELRVC